MSTGAGVKALILGGWPWTQEMYDKLYSAVPVLKQTYGVNTLVLIIDYRFEFVDQPGKPMAHLQGSGPFTRAWAAELVARAAVEGIRVIPLINLLGHQTSGWNTTTDSPANTFALLREYPGFTAARNEYAEALNPNAVVQASDTGPGKYPEGTSVRTIVADLMDDILDAFQADALHVGLDEVEDTTLAGFVDYAQFLRDHLASRGVEMWMWGDRLLPGGTDCAAWYDGYFESADNGTDPAVGLLGSQNIVVTDWHYSPSSSSWYSCTSGPRHPGEYPSINPARSNSLVANGFKTVITTHNEMAGTQEATAYAFDHVGDGMPSTPRLSANSVGAATVFWGNPVAYLDCLDNTALCPSTGVYFDTVEAFKWQMLNYQPAP